MEASRDEGAPEVPGISLPLSECKILECLAPDPEALRVLPSAGGVVVVGFLDRQDLYRDKLSPLGKRQIGLRYLRQARSAWSAGDCDNAFRFCNLALHYNPNDIEMLRLRQEIVAANPHLDVPLRNRVREGLRPGERPHVNYPREGVPWQKPAPVISPDDMLPPLPSRPGSIKRLDP